jgi:NACalpha-BTF3-like transcription factor
MAETKPLTPKKSPKELQKIMKDMGIDINEIDLSRVKMQEGGTKRQQIAAKMRAGGTFKGSF